MERGNRNVQSERLIWVQDQHREEFQKEAVVGLEGPRVIWVQSSGIEASSSRPVRQQTPAGSPSSRPTRQQASTGSQSSRPARQQAPAGSQSSRSARQQSSVGIQSSHQSSRSVPQPVIREYSGTRSVRQKAPTDYPSSHPARQSASAIYPSSRPMHQPVTREYSEAYSVRQPSARDNPTARSVRQPSARESSTVRSYRQQATSQQSADPSRSSSHQGRSARQSAKRRKAIKHREYIRVFLEVFGIVATGFFLALFVRGIAEGKSNPENKVPASFGEQMQSVLNGSATGKGSSEDGTMIQGIPAEIFEKHPEWEENYLTPNEYSRPGDALTEVKNIFVHYTANPSTSAAQNRSYFEQQKDTHENSVSSHFIIGYNGEILQIVPLDEIAYAVKTRNFDSISIECCYKAKNGQFTQETYDSLVSLLSWLMEAYGLDSEDILRHYDCGGKKCPLYYVDHEDAWEQLKKDVKNHTP